jgi:hypothetical protein
MANNLLKIPKTRQKAIQKHFIEVVENHARARQKAQGKLDEIDFFCGVMTALEALLGKDDWATLSCPWWIWGPISGQPILNKKEEK